MPISSVTLLKGDGISLETDYLDRIPENMYAVIKPMLGATGYMLSYPGLTKLGATADIGVGKDRGGVYNERFGEQYRVSGEKLIRVNTAAGTVTELGTIPDSAQVAMPYSFNTQAVITRTRMFLYDPTAGFREVTDADLGDPIDGIWIDGYYFLTDGEYIYHTDISDEESIHPLKFATAEFMPDLSLGLGKTQDNKAMVFGRYTIEYFQNVSSVNFAFSRIATRALKIGIVATHAKCEATDKWYITGGRKHEAIGVHAISSGITKKVSTREIDRVLAQYTEPYLADMRMECYMEYGSLFILIHLPRETLCFNENIASTLGLDQAWSILRSGVLSTDNYRAINGIFDANTGKWIYGDKFNANIGILDSTVFTHYEARNEWVLYSPFLKFEGQSINEIEIETVPGASIIDDDAVIAVSLTYDGISYGTEWFQLYSNTLDYNQRFIIRRLGHISNWAGIKFRGATKSKMAFSLVKVSHD